VAYTADDLMKCDPQPGQCERCVWGPLCEELCPGTCIGDSICPWLMVCQCLNPDMDSGRGHQLERLVLQQPPVVQVTPVGILASRLRMDSYDIRLRRDAENVQAIAESIVMDGLFAPPGGVASADGHIDVIMGHTRVLAMRDVLSWTQIPMRIFHWWGDTDWDRRARAFKENGLRRNMDFDEEVALVYGYWRETRQSVRQVARFFGMGRTWAHERIAWGKKVIGEAPAGIGNIGAIGAVGVSDDNNSSGACQCKRTYPRRVTLPAAEVREWLDRIQRAGITIPQNGPGEEPDAEALRNAMQAVLDAVRR